MSVNLITLIKQEFSLLSELNRLVIAPNRVIQVLESREALQPHHAQALSLLPEAECAAQAVQHAATSPGSVNLPYPMSKEDVHREIDRIANAAAGEQKAARLDVGLRPDELQLAEFVNSVIGDVAETAETVRDLCDLGPEHPAVQFACAMAIVCLDNVLEALTQLRPSPGTSQLIIA